MIEEKVSLSDLILKYCLRDTLIGILNIFPGAPGFALRMAIMPHFFQTCGKGLRVHNYTTFIFPERMEIGEQVSFNEYAWVNATGGITIGNMVRISPHVSIVSFDHEFKDPNTPIKDQYKRLGRIVIEDDVWIGTHATITQGVRIGKGSVIGAGAVVTEDIPPYSVAVGVPARVIKSRG